MKYFVLGVVVTLAILYPDTTKHIFGSLVDTVHNVTTSVMQNAGNPPSDNSSL